MRPRCPERVNNEINHNTAGDEELTRRLGSELVRRHPAWE
jgi:hypothetical protein